MSLFVDASALVALIAREPERDDFVRRIAAETALLWSAMSCWETVSALRRSHGLSLDDARRDLDLTTRHLGFTLVPIGESEREAALDAYQRYGKGRHPAKLNMGDCFAYACAKTNNARLLYKGDDFAKTDLA
ncbi:type II toxin-antitoxin system VapC family toxin [Sphingomonas sp. AP4-R1]|uniref:type II toxin-antitoxin system VapC family toxin n=1 Tax=Sphingomonas sp. AP4-R1 TaxID=2735134 RepID=UPI0014939DD8|nr:type II toxin-antitoxin system VapC family toxin [Sphingomonas sp. AP4-R1]QJU59014.1 type II toxin-antitoxin system VapC family toxin [Sphingomonas sp. AP4-R1]